MSGSVTEDLEHFRQKVRAWLRDNFPSSLKGVTFLGMNEKEIKPARDYRGWKKAICANGWSAPTWPADYGGGGLSVPYAQTLREEFRKAGAYNPIAGGMGMRMLGPTLLEYGTEEQKQRHIPLIVRGESRWCQGYSEPGAGSDLASLRTQALDQGDHFLVNGQKIWTSGANFATWCFCLVRTDNTRKHEGISFLLIDMSSPGIEVRPIRLISGESPFCEVFFTDVRVPKENLVGPLNGGWTIGKRLLQFERQGVDGVGLNREGDARPVQDIAKEYVGVDSRGQIADRDLRARLTQHLMDAQAYRLTVQRLAEAGGQNPTATTSIMKNARTRIGQDRAELVLEIMGHNGIGWEGEGYSRNELDAARAWLSGKATTIYAGSYEIQNNIIAKRILGLLDHQ